MPQYKDEQRNTWYFKCQYTDWQGVKKAKLQRGFKTKAEAKKAETEFLALLSDNCTITFEVLAKHFLEHNKHCVKPASYLQNESIIRTILLPYFKDMQIDKITPLVIQKWQDNIKHSDKHYKSTTLKTINARLSAIFNYATKFFKLKENPVKIAGSIGVAKSHNIEFWTVDEFNKFIDCLKNAEFHKNTKGNKFIYEVAFKMLFYTGVRFGEFSALTIGDYDKEKHTLNINKTTSYINSKTILIQTTKTRAGERIISLPSKLCALLDKYIEMLPSQDAQDTLFPFYRSQRIERMQTAISKKAGVKRIRIHDLRHSHASMLINLGVPVLAISKRLGHEKIETTLNIYSHLYPNASSDIANSLDKYII